MAGMTFDELVELVDQLSGDEQTALLKHLLERTSHRDLSVSEKLKLLRAAQIPVQVNQEPSVRRADWYGEDGR
jgi:hypothetical protein